MTSLANALLPSSCAAAALGPKRAIPGGAHGVGDAGDERGLRADDDEVDAERRREGGGGRGVGEVERVEPCASAAMPGVAGRRVHLRRRGPAARARTRACSRAPVPRTRTFTRAEPKGEHDSRTPGLPVKAFPRALDGGPGPAFTPSGDFVEALRRPMSTRRVPRRDQSHEHRWAADHVSRRTITSSTCVPSSLESLLRRECPVSCAWRALTGRPARTTRCRIAMVSGIRPVATPSAVRPRAAWVRQACADRSSRCSAPRRRGTRP